MLDITVNDYMHIKDVKQWLNKIQSLRLRSHITLV
jgi:hypothetical protein